MIKFIILSLIVGLVTGCGLTKLANKADEVVDTVNVKVEEIKGVYLDLKGVYIQKKETYIVVKKILIEKDILTYLSENDPKTKEILIQIDKDLIQLDQELIEFDKKVTGNYLKWQDYLAVSKKITNQMRNVDTAMQIAATLIKKAVK